MRYFTLLLSAFIFWSASASAATHLDLRVTIHMEQRLLKVEGSASDTVRLPSGEETSGAFSYNWGLGTPTSARDWQRGVFSGEDNLYLPYGWHPETKGLMTFTLDIAAPLVVIAPGELQNETQTESSYEARFMMDKPTEGIPLFAGPFKIAQLRYKDILLRTYFYEGMEDLSLGYLERTARYLETFEAKIGPYPFRAFHIVASPLPVGLGFAGLTYIGQRVLYLPFIKESSLGHEILHNWWGNGVYPDYLKGNWSEGLTTYMADYMTAEAASEKKARDMRLSWLRDYAALPADQDTPVTEFVSKHGQASQVIGYHKVAFIFHMLRRELGDQTFFSALRNFWRDYQFKTADWADIEATFSKTVGRDLAPFFQQWVFQKGAPQFKSVTAQAQKVKSEGWKVRATLVQNSPEYRLQVPLAVGIKGGLYDYRMRITKTIGMDEFWVRGKPDALSLDPDFHIFRRLNVDEAPPILRDLALQETIELVALDFKEPAQTLVGRMVDGDVRIASSKKLPERPFILVGTHETVTAQIKSWILPPTRLPTKDGATALVWVDRLQNGAPYAVISVKNEAALGALMRPLPHYGKRNGLIFNASKAIFTSSGQTRPMAITIH